jgi:CHAT domain
MNYLDFFLEVRATHDTKCFVTVRSPVGECDNEITLPLNREALSALRAKLHGDAVRLASAPRDSAPRGDASSGQRDLSVVSAPEVRPIEFGKSLYGATFQRRVGQCFAASCERARHERKRLRVNLVTHGAAMAMVPWELLCSELGNYLCLSQHTPLVRYLYVDKPAVSLRIEPPLQMLGVLSSGGGAPLDLEQERSRIDAALAPLRCKGLAHVTWLENPTCQGLREALARKNWHILHFAGHGTFGLLAMPSEAGGQGHLRANDLRVLLRDCDSLRMVFLNACDGAAGDGRELFSSTATLVAEAGVPAVLAMQFPVSDRAATDFAHQVYRQIARGESIEAAVTEARKSISIGGSLEWATPVLFIRSTGGAFLPAPKSTWVRLAGVAMLCFLAVAGAFLYLKSNENLPSEPCAALNRRIDDLRGNERGPARELFAVIRKYEKAKDLSGADSYDIDKTVRRVHEVMVEKAEACQFLRASVQCADETNSGGALAKKLDGVVGSICSSAPRPPSSTPPPTPAPPPSISAGPRPPPAPPPARSSCDPTPVEHGRAVMAGGPYCKEGSGTVTCSGDNGGSAKPETKSLWCYCERGKPRCTMTANCVQSKADCQAVSRK